jgi:hypothetical protein
MKQIRVIMHKKMSQGNSLYSYLKKQKCPFFFFLLQNQRIGEQNRFCPGDRGLVPVEIGKGRWWGKGVGG